MNGYDFITNLHRYLYCNTFLSTNYQLYYLCFYSNSPISSRESGGRSQLPRTYDSRLSLNVLKYGLETFASSTRPAVG